MTLSPELIEAAMSAFRARLLSAAESMGASQSPADFCDAERVVQGLAQELAADITQRLLQEMSDDADRRKEALARVRRRCAPRGIKLRIERRRRTQIRTLSGRVIEVVTPYATARPISKGRPLATRGSQGTGVYPVLDQLGIEGRSTPALRFRVARSVCEANSVSSARDLLESNGVEIDHKAALRLTYMVTDVALRARKDAVATTAAGDDGGEFVERRVVATVDGGRTMIRRRVAGRPKAGGRKRFVTEWREPKVLTIYVLGPDGRRDRSIPSVIDGTFGDADAVFALLRHHLLRLGAHRAVELCFVGDAAPWIWKRTDALREDLGLPREQFHEVVDYFHVVERLGKYADARPGWTDERRGQWVAAQKKKLKAGEIESIEASIRVIADHERARDSDAYKTESAYWARHRDRMRYSALRAAGLPNGSGAVESSVRRVINLRLKGASIAWIEEHAEGVLHLRAHAKSGRWTELEKTVLAWTGWRPTARRPKSVA